MKGLLAREALHERAARARRAARLRGFGAGAFAVVLIGGLVFLGAVRAMELASWSDVEACPLPHEGGWVDVSGPSDLPPLRHGADCPRRPQ